MSRHWNFKCNTIFSTTEEFDPAATEVIETETYIEKINRSYKFDQNK